MQNKPKYSPAGAIFVQRFQDFIQQENLLPRESKILIAVSGGGDSMALATVLVQLQKKYHWELRLAHVNYGLRGQDSLLDETLVRKFARQHTLPLSVLQSTARPKKNIEAQLRDIRYSYFEKLRRRYHLSIIVTAHTQNDLAETFLMNLLRGAGAHGLSLCMQNPLIVRPLVSFSKKSILDFLTETNTPFRHDTSNDDLTYTRNKIRHLLLPFLEREFNPNITPSLARTSQLLKQSSFQNPLLWKLRPQVWTFDRKIFLNLTPNQQRSFLSQVFRTILKNSLSNQFILEVQKALRSEKSKRQILTTRDLKIECFSVKVEITLRLKK